MPRRTRLSPSERLQDAEAIARVLLSINSKLSPTGLQKIFGDGTWAALLTQPDQRVNGLLHIADALGISVPALARHLPQLRSVIRRRGGSYEAKASDLYLLRPRIQMARSVGQGRRADKTRNASRSVTGRFARGCKVLESMG